MRKKETVAVGVDVDNLVDTVEERICIFDLVFSQSYKKKND